MSQSVAYLKFHDLVHQRLQNKGPFVDLNDIDVSEVTNMRGLFKDVDFRGDISKWDTSHVTDMSMMFENSTFNGDISKWNVSKVTGMLRMFEGSSFNGDISQWNVESAGDMARMFRKTAFGGDLSSWKPQRCLSFLSMFDGSTFAGDLSGWTIQKIALTDRMFSRHFEGICPHYDAKVYEHWGNLFCPIDTEDMTFSEAVQATRVPILMKLPIQRLHWAAAWLAPTQFNGPPEILTFVQRMRPSIQSFDLTFDDTLDMLSSLYAQSAPVMNTTFEFAYDH